MKTFMILFFELLAVLALIAKYASWIALIFLLTQLTRETKLIELATSLLPVVAVGIFAQLETNFLMQAINKLRSQ